MKDNNQKKTTRRNPENQVHLGPAAFCHGARQEAHVPHVLNDASRGQGQSQRTTELEDRRATWGYLISIGGFNFFGEHQPALKTWR